MPLVTGSQLGSYEVLALIGEGGMGQVYRARDSKLGRHVAIKVLPDAVQADPDRVARFEREAKVLAALNHPNIATLFGVEEVEGRHFLIMELVEGETLADRLARTSGSTGLPLEEALTIARQIAEAVEAAHEKGIVHRDLKPANVKLTADGKVKVLDFGLARAMEPRSGADAASSPVYVNSPTLSAVATQAGVILGTAAYMSPEQAKGFQADHRSDIFSFGIVLHELLTGRQPFQGETAAEVLASVLIRDADLAALPGDLNPRLAELVRRCLEKNPKKRWQAIGDVRVELDAIASAPRSAVSFSAPSAPMPLWRRAIPLVAASVVVGAISAGAAWFLKPAAQQSDVTRFSFPLGEGQTFTNPGRHLVAISPDGRRMAYVANNQLYVRSMNDLEAKPILGSNDPGGVTSPIFSPGGESIAFFAASGNVATGGTIKKIAITGGTASTICTCGNPYGMSWDGNSILFGAGRQGIMRVSASGGQPAQVASVNADELAHGPQMLPDGEHLLFSIAEGSGLPSRWDSAQIVVQSLKSGERKPIFIGGSDARYLPTGHLLFAAAGTVFAVPFDQRRLEVRGGPTPVLEGVRRPNAAQTGAAHLGVSRNGSLMYVPGPVTAFSGQQVLGLLDRKGTLTPLKLPPGSYQHVRAAPDGKRIAFTVDDGKEENVWVYELSGGSSARLLTFGGNNRFPIWTRDGQRIAFQSDREKDLAIWWQRADTSGGTAERLTTPTEGTAHIPESWAPNADLFLYSTSKDSTRTLWSFSLQDRKEEQIDNIRSTTPIGAGFSPDGHWITYYSNEEGTSSVYVQPFPPTREKYLISRGIGVGGGARQPIWSPDGKELLFFSAITQMTVVSVQTQPSFSARDPVSLPVRNYVTANTGTPRNHDILPDGQRFVVAVPVDQVQANAVTTTSEIHVVLNWFEELKQRVPTR